MNKCQITSPLVLPELCGIFPFVFQKLADFFMQLKESLKHFLSG